MRKILLLAWGVEERGVFEMGLVGFNGGREWVGDLMGVRGGFR